MKQHYPIYSKKLFSLIFSFLFLNLVRANSELLTPACNDTIYLSLDINCVGMLQPDIVLEAPDSMNDYRIFITSPNDSTGNYTNNGTDSVILLQTGIFRYSIIDTSGNFCSGQIIVEDKLAPIFTSIPRDTFVRCSFGLTPSEIGATPQAMDNCGTASVTFEYAFVEKGLNACDTLIVASLWKASDAVDNSTIDTQRTVFIQPTTNQLIAPADITLSCGEDDPADINNLSKTGIPSIQIGKMMDAAFVPTDTVSFDENSNNCHFGISHRDIVKQIDCELTVTRIWEVIDWCSSNSSSNIIDTQIIRLIDTIAPVFEPHEYSNLLAPKRIELNRECLFDVIVNSPVAKDNCDTLPQVEMYEVARLVNGVFVNIGNNLTAVSLIADTFRVGYRAFDYCVNQSKEDTTYIYLIAEDRIGPTVICANDLVVSIANDQGVILDATTVDDGSFDACGNISRAIRRKGIDSIWQSSILLPCELIDSQLIIELRVMDMLGNENICWTSVRLEDKVSPICQNLPDQTTTCDEIKANDFGVTTDTNNDGKFDETEWRSMSNNQMLVYNLTFGTPACVENITCQFFTIEQQYQRLESICGMAQIQRRYRGIDQQGNIGEWTNQKITVNYQVDWTVTFSPDWEGSCNDIIPIPFIKVQNGACDRLSISITEKTFPAEEDYCLKVERTYQILNPCLLIPSTAPFTIVRPEDTNGNVVDSFTISSDSLGLNAHLLYKQILKIRSTEQPQLVIQEVETCLTGIHIDSISTKIDSLPVCAELRTFSATAKDCVGNDITRYLWNFYENDHLVATGTGSTFTKAVLPDVDYTVQFIAIDACNNQAEERKIFTFQDCAKPTLFTRTGIALELTKKEVTIWATDFDNGSHDNCTDKLILLENFRIWHEQLGFDYPEDIATIKRLPDKLTFTCEELATQEVFIYAFDAADNFDYLSTFIAIQDNKASCLERDRIRIGGEIVNEKGKPIEGVRVDLLGEQPTDKITATDGYFTFEIPKGENYTLQPIKNSDPLNGITTFDLILINKHILGISRFTSPYQHIAADVNKSGTITAFDLVQLRKLILNLIPSFPNNNSWRFVDQKYEFSTATPEGELFSENMLLNYTHEDPINLNFIGIKIGDINGSAKPNSVQIADDRKNKKVFTFKFQDRWIEKGEVVEIPFILDSSNGIEGLQFGLTFERLEIMNFIEGLATAEHFNLMELNRGRLAMSWHKTDGLTYNKLFSVEVKAKKKGLLSHLLQITSNGIEAEAYTNSKETMRIALSFIKKNKGNRLKLFQNQPNPFNDQTTIPFYLPHASIVHFKIMDVQGRVLQHIVERYETGYQEVTIDKQTLSTSGILYYQLTDGTTVATKKMMVLE